MLNRLLVIDDDPAFGRLVKRAAEPCGFEVRASNSDNCRGEVASWRPAIIVLDLSMPGIDGIEVLRCLAADKCAARIILANGIADPAALEAAARFGAERRLNMGAFLRKPARAAELQRLLGLIPATEKHLLCCAQTANKRQTLAAAPRQPTARRLARRRSAGYRSTPCPHSPSHCQGLITCATKHLLWFRGPR